MSGEYNAGEIERIVAGLIRFGRIIEVDAANARVKVATGGLTTDWMPWQTGRAGTTRHWSAPSVGEQVTVLAPHGDPTQGIVLPGVYQDNHPAPDSSGDKDVTVFGDGTRFEYDAASNTYTQTVAGSGNWVFNLKVATINADTSVTLNAPQTTCTGALTVQGLLTYQDGIAGSGGSNGNAISGSMAITGGDVVADGIGVKSHHHTEQGDNAATSAAQA